MIEPQCSGPWQFTSPVDCNLSLTICTPYVFVAGPNSMIYCSIVVAVENLIITNNPSGSEQQVQPVLTVSNPIWPYHNFDPPTTCQLSQEAVNEQG